MFRTRSGNFGRTVSITGLAATTAQAGPLKSYATDFSSQNKNKPVVVKENDHHTVVRQPRVTAAPGQEPLRGGPRPSAPGGGAKKFGGGNNTVVKQKTTVTDHRQPEHQAQLRRRQQSPARCRRARSSSSRLDRGRSARSLQARAPRQVRQARPVLGAGVEERPEKDMVGQQVEGVRPDHRTRRGGAGRRVLLPGRLPPDLAKLLRRHLARRLPPELAARRLRGWRRRLAMRAVLPPAGRTGTAAHGRAGGPAAATARAAPATSRSTPSRISAAPTLRPARSRRSSARTAGKTRSRP